jgi:RHS repeat-associated protein
MAEGNTTTTLAYGDSDHPHAVTSRMGSTTASPTSQPDSYTYDRDGNIAARTGGEKYTFDAENRLSTVASYPTQTSYWYDGLGNMDCRWTTTSPGLPSAADVRDRYIDGLYEEHSVFGQKQYTIKDYYAFGRIIAQRKTTTGTNPTSSVTYLLADHLGSTVGTVSDAGVTEHMQYYPFGSVRSGHVSTDRGFTGQRREGGSRLGAYFYHARFYATGLGHFLSADTASTDGLDRYAYAGFNPVRYSDPSGHVWTSDGGGSCDTICQWQAAWTAFHPEQAAHGGGPAQDCDAQCLQTIAGLVQCAANYDACTGSGAAPPTPSQTPVPDSADAGPLPGACGSTCPSVPIHPNSEATRPGACALCPLAPVAKHAYNIVTSDCFQGLTKVTAMIVGGAFVLAIVGPEVATVAGTAAGLFAGGALIDVQAAYAVAGNSVVIYGIAKYGGPTASPGMSMALSGAQQIGGCLS